VSNDSAASISKRTYSPMIDLDPAARVPPCSGDGIEGLRPMVKPGGVSPGGYGARIRDGLFDESLYRLRAVGEGIFGALTMEFGDRMRTRRKESSETRLLRLMVYYLKVVARWLYG
jgi:hypothetical protein